MIPCTALNSILYLLRRKFYHQVSDNMIAPLLAMLTNIKPLSAHLEASLIHYFKIEKIQKGKILLHEGDVCENLWFLANGLLRSYHNIGQKEITSRIMFTNHIVISPGSFFTQTAATESIEALSDCIVAKLSFTNLQIIYEKFPEFNCHTRLVTEQYFYTTEQRLYMLRKQDAVSKYLYFMDNYASFMKDIPQKFIASFLNITPETLSRTRSKIRK